jgi:hypothetical protein
VAHGGLCAVDGAADDVFDVLDVEAECFADVDGSDLAADVVLEVELAA